jgi:hypothetical protein
MPATLDSRRLVSHVKFTLPSSTLSHSPSPTISPIPIHGKSAPLRLSQLPQSDSDSDSDSDSNSNAEDSVTNAIQNLILQSDNSDSTSQGSSNRSRSPRAGPHSKNRSQHASGPAGNKRRFAASDVWKFFEDLNEKKQCIFCRYVSFFVGDYFIDTNS